MRFTDNIAPTKAIVPAIIHDGDEIPQAVRSIQAAKLQEYSNAFMTPKSASMEDLSNKICQWIPDVAKAIKRAPNMTKAGFNSQLTNS